MLDFRVVGGRQANVKHHRDQFLFLNPCGNASDCPPYEVTLSVGNYIFEAWGSQGRIIFSGKPGLGGYVKGRLVLNSSSKFYFFIGNDANYLAAPIIVNSPSYGWGGGASDVRLLFKNDVESWYEFESLKSRIMIAGGGGGAEWSCAKGGNAGGFEGGTGYSCLQAAPMDPEINATGGTQTQGGTFSENWYGGDNGSFGISGMRDSPTDYGGIGGGGYYGGASRNYAGGGGGGSSFISGYQGCRAITENSTKNKITHKPNSIHFSGIFFEDAVMIPGGNEMPSPEGGSESIGHEGYGAIRITILPTDPFTKFKRKNLFRYMSYSLPLLFKC